MIVLAFGTAFCGLSGTLFFLSTYFLGFKGLQLRVNLAMWIATIFMFTVSASHYALSWAITLKEVQGSFEIPRSSQTVKMMTAQSYLPIINYLLSDGIIVWRAWVLWNRKIKMVIAPIFLLAVLTPSAPSHRHKVENGASLACETAVWALTLSTNALTTFLIAFQAWKHHRRAKRHFENGGRRVKVEAVLALLAESGAFYCVVWIVYMISQFRGHIKMTTPFFGHGSLFTEMMPIIVVNVSGSYPLIIIVLISLQRTAWDMTFDKPLSTNEHLHERAADQTATRARDHSSSIIEIQLDRYVTIHDDNFKEIEQPLKASVP
ncbi:hypothetical protein HETIRDRAFT_411750 [Heterobasidion irregulare TC 32-1]|uniref:Uncharacterized protein n=1 Tax=Heterobasidion irregulare (strain TC 32-1) TaxID=747525 RepID=W4JX24_HETIT|nr:uncharacterized protein HETIRDRAFT_411750 [Heterobasidion irregulare TC 32-1]ETW77635.1 hypothetical protein HETIRDRAFT_411750 [Heterobasidion irregulare TC 32-1]